DRLAEDQPAELGAQVVAERRRLRHDGAATPSEAEDIAGAGAGAAGEAAIGTTGRSGPRLGITRPEGGGPARACPVPAGGRADPAPLGGDRGAPFRAVPAAQRDAVHLLDDLAPADAGVVGAEADLSRLRRVGDDAHLGAAEVVVEEVLEPHPGDRQQPP